MMKRLMQSALLVLLSFGGLTVMAYPASLVPANHPFIQYYGRWDMTDPLHPKQSWPGVYIVARFSGTSIGIRTNDNVDYYNVYIDGAFHSVFHAGKPEEADYTLASGLKKGNHTLLFSRRNMAFGNPYSIGGLILDDGATLLKPPAKPARRIEFIGDSFTAAEGNEAVEKEMPWEAKFPVTNIDKGFAPVIARHYGAQYQTTCRSGAGVVADWQGSPEGTVPKRFDRTLSESSEPRWDFKKFMPQLVVICLGLNDSSGLKGKDGRISEENSARFRKGYHDFVARVRSAYPGVKILAVAAFPEWIRKNVGQVVEEEKKAGHRDIYYGQFDEFPGGYVATGHPNVETHQKMAEQIIKYIDTMGVFGVRR